VQSCAELHCKLVFNAGLPGSAAQHCSKLERLAAVIESKLEASVMSELLKRTVGTQPALKALLA
jgi:hypothetical protein